MSRAGVTFVIYHPFRGFLVDTDGAWSTDRDEAKSNATYEAALAVLGATMGNGMEPMMGSECRILEWW